MKLREVLSAVLLMGSMSTMAQNLPLNTYLKSHEKNETTITISKEKPIDVTEREVKSSYYKDDTLKVFFNRRWQKCMPEMASYYSIAYKVGNSWVCDDYYIQEMKIFNHMVYTDKLLKNKQGQCLNFYSNGKLSTQGQYFNNAKTGWWLTFDMEGNILDSSRYLNDVPAGRNVSFYPTGKIAEVKYMDKQGHGIGTDTAYYTTGAVKTTGIFASGMLKDKTWTSFSENGQVIFTENYDHGKLQSSSCFDANGKTQTDCIALQLPEFPGGEKALDKYIAENLKFPEGMELTNTKKVSVVAQFVINETGGIENIKILKEPSPEFGYAVIKLLKNMPLWKPGIELNKIVKSSYILPVSFSAVADFSNDTNLHSSYPK